MGCALVVCEVAKRKAWCSDVDSVMLFQTKILVRKILVKVKKGFLTFCDWAAGTKLSSYSSD